MVIGPSSSRLIKASSLFVDRVEVRDEDRKGVSVYGFSEKPQLSYETNWTVSNYLIVGSYNRKVKSRIHQTLLSQLYVHGDYRTETTMLT